MKLQESKRKSSGPSSAIGIMQFTDSLEGPKITPESVIIISVIFIAVILFLKVLI